MIEKDKLERYRHQILFQGILEEGQKKILQGHATVVGCGALGSMSATALARAGVGYIRIIDRDFVEMKNLHRQILYDENDAKRFIPKAVAAEEKLKAINADIQVEGVVADVSYLNVENLLSGTSVVVDGTDNFETRFLLNEFSVKKEIPWIYGGCVGSYGLAMNIIPGQGPCLRCVFEKSPPAESMETCDTAGVIPTVAYLVASVQSTEALKILSGKSEMLNKSIVKVDVWKGTFQSIAIGKQGKDCDVCDHKKFPLLEGRGVIKTAALCGRDSVQIYGEQEEVMDLQELKKKLEKVGDVLYNGYLLKIHMEGHDIIVFPDGRAIIGGTDDTARAKTIYAKYIGN
jgi:adenylyltransferase/sulfurtransferase